jgi:hypothetical protein
MVAEIVDCSAPFLLVAIPQNRFSDIDIGSQVRFRLAGERTEQTGSVLSVTGRGDLTKGHHYAAIPVDEPSTVIVEVAMPNRAYVPEETCLIGRSARVLISASRGGFIDQIIRSLF